jgi:hypothetical protein
MENLNLNNPASPSPIHRTPSSDDLNKPIPLADPDKPIPLDLGPAPKTNVSHAPLNLGGPAAPAPAARPPMPRPVAQRPAARVVSTDRITGVKTFFTKLHPGALQFLDEQITEWLRQNPGISIKRTDVTTGEVQAKKSEPNIIINVWY